MTRRRLAGLWIVAVGAGCIDQPPPLPPEFCGNGALEEFELCDGEESTETCESLGFFGGLPSCRDDCTIDDSTCTRWGEQGMVLVAAGSFTMGSNEVPAEGPVREVILGAFYIDATEVTVRQYSVCVDAGRCTPPETGIGFNYQAAGREEHPVNGVAWTGANQYCGWRDGGAVRLPTEAEWEKAARGTDARTYPWGDDPEPSCQLAIMAEDGGQLGCGANSTAPVGSLPDGASPYGALDMAGNVFEWVGDWYGPYDPTDTRDPTGPAEGERHVIRGGGWESTTASSLRTAFRNDFDDTPDIAIGFRCAKAAD